MRTGIIYKATSLTSGKKYIGKTIDNLSKRKDRHRNDAFNKANKGYSIHFHRAIRKYGIDDFVWEIIYTNIPEDLLNHMEIITVELYDTYHNGYNSTAGGEGISGYRHTKESKQRMSESHKDKRRGENSPSAKLNWVKIKDIREKYASGNYSHTKLAKEYNVSRSNIYLIIRNKNWLDNTYIPPERPGTKLNWILVTEIRDKYASGNYLQHELAKEYDVSNVTINTIITNKKWIDSNYIYIIDNSRIRKEGYLIKLNLDKAKEIRKKYKTKLYTYRKLATEYNVSRSVICNIINNKIWKE